MPQNTEMGHIQFRLIIFNNSKQYYSKRNRTRLFITVTLKAAMLFLKVMVQPSDMAQILKPALLFAECAVQILKGAV
jgi:hypothetical protein